MKINKRYISKWLELLSSIIAIMGMICLYLLFKDVYGNKDHNEQFILRIIPGIFTALLLVLFGSVFSGLNKIRRAFELESLQDKIDKKIYSLVEKISVLKDIGVVDYHKMFDFDKFTQLVAESKSRVIIFQMWMFFDADDYRECFSKLSQVKNHTVKIFLLDPQSDLVEHRTKDCSTNGQNIDVGNEIHGNLDFFEEISKEYEIDIEIKIFDSIPPFQLYLVDDIAFVGFYPQGERATKAFQLKVCKLDGGAIEDTTFGDFIVSEFNKRWERENTHYKYSQPRPEGILDKLMKRKSETEIKTK